MPPIMLFALQALLLILLYLFVARAVRAILRDVQTPTPATRQPTSSGRRPAPASTPGRQGAQPRAAQGQGGGGPAPRQLVVHHAGGRPQSVALDGREVRFGRDRDCEVVLDGDSYVSSRHARVFPQDGSWVVADMGSTNGTYLNRERVRHPSPIKPGDQLTIGRTIVEVRK